MEFFRSPESAFLIFTLLHFTIGRTASVVYAIINHLPLHLYLPLAWGYDFIQIPVYGFLLERSSRIPLLRWVKTRIKRASEAWQRKKLVQRVSSLGDVGIVLLCALPIRGFGVLSATVVAYLLGKGRIKGATLLVIGSLLGISLTVGLMKGAIGIWWVLKGG
ncbi:MAG: small multi-drug export protein [Deltaproteobacteria bacterium]|nr:small multi-drug export protein [Deltaproteobacteria bacterium]